MFAKRTAWETSSNAISRAIARRRGSRQADPRSHGVQSDASGARLSGAGSGRGWPPWAIRIETRWLLRAPPFGDALARAGVDRQLLPEPRYRYLRGSDPGHRLDERSLRLPVQAARDPATRSSCRSRATRCLRYLADLECVHLVGYPLRWDGEWHVDLPMLREALDERTRAIVVVSPNNPTGSFLKTPELAALVSICRERGLALLCGRIFSDYGLVPSDGRRVESVLVQDHALAFALSGLSKIVAAPQFKLGWLAATGPEGQVRAALDRLEVISDTYLSVNTPAQLALPRLLSERQRVQEPLKRRLATNLQAIQGIHTPSAAWQPLRVEGGWTALLQIPRVRSEEDWVVALAEEDGVVVYPGYFFDFSSEAYLAVSLIAEPGSFREGLEDRQAHRLSSSSLAALRCGAS